MNKRLKKYLKRGILILISLYLLTCALLYFFQEKILFHPEVVPKSTAYSFESTFEEKFYEVEKGVELNTLLFSADSISGERKLIFYIHGNGDNLSNLGNVSTLYTNLGYDCFMYDYRGYGKSDGLIELESRLFSDAQILYARMLQFYKEENITIVGYSIGTGIASWLAAKNSPNKLILEAPYFSMIDMMKSKYPIIQSSILRYPLETDKRLKETKCPIFIFHGDKDEVIPYSSSTKLKELIKRIDLTRLAGIGHNGITQSEKYRQKLNEILSN